MTRSDDDRHAAPRRAARLARARAAGVAEATKELKAALDDVKKQEA